MQALKKSVKFWQIQTSPLTSKTIHNCMLKNDSVVRLNICSNSIGDKGLCKLAAVLKNNTTLKVLYIWGNKMGEPTCNVSFTS